MIRSACRTAIAIAALVSSVSGLNAAAQQRALPTVQYQTEWYNEISTTKMQLETITLITDVAAPVESAKRSILPYVKGCSPVQKEPTSGVYYSVCVPAVNSNLIEIGKILARLEKSGGSDAVRYEIHLFNPQFPDAEQTATYDEIVEMRPPPANIRLALAGGATIQGVALTSSIVPNQDNLIGHYVQIQPNYEWVGPATQCVVQSAKREPMTAAEYDAYIEIVRKEYREAGAKIVENGRMVRNDWKSASFIATMVQNGRTKQRHYQSIVWLHKGSAYGLEAVCELNLDASAVKINDVVRKRLLIVHPEIGPD